MARPIGSKNKIPQETREVLKTLLENNITKLDEWINKVARTDPAKACDLVLAVTHYVIPRLKSIEITEPTPVLPVLVVRNGMAEIPDDYPGPAVRINTPEYHAQHPPQGHVVNFIDPASGTDRQQDVIVIPRKDGRDPLVILDWDGIQDDEPTEAPPAPPPTAPAPPAPPAPAPPPTSPPRTMAEVRRRRNSW